MGVMKERNDEKEAAEDEPDKNEDMENLINNLGGFGRYQIYIFFISCVGSFCGGMAVVNIGFVGMDLSYRCLIPSCETTNATEYNRDFLNFTTRWDDEGEKWDGCVSYVSVTNGSELSDDANRCSSIDFLQDDEEECSSFVYDTSLFASTTVNEFELTCDRAWLQPYGNSMYMFGMLVGSLILGDLSDRYGRKIALLICAIIDTISGFVSAFSVNYIMFLATRFVMGFGNVASYSIAFVIVIEFVPAKYRRLTGMMICLPFAFGEAANSPIAYFFRDWRWIQALSTSPNIILILLVSCCLPESIRWLISKGRFDEAKILIEKAGKMNRRTVTPKMIRFLEKNNPIESPETDGKLIKFEEEEGKEAKRSLLELFKNPKMGKRTLNLTFAWIVITMAYYGLSANTANLGGDVFVNFIAVMLIEVPSYIFGYLLMDWMGRKGIILFSLWISGVGCIISGIFVTDSDMQMVVIAASMAGKFGAATAFGLVYVYTAEIFPTDLRGTGVGLCSMAGRLGGMAAPFVSDLAKIYQPLPLFVFGILSLISGSLVILLPETAGRDLPQTIEESERLGSDQSIFYFECLSRKKKVDKEYNTKF